MYFPITTHTSPVHVQKEWQQTLATQLRVWVGQQQYNALAQVTMFLVSLENLQYTS